MSRPRRASRRHSARLASHRSHRSHRSRGTALVPGEIRRLAEPLLPRPRAEGRGEPREVGPAPARGGNARGPHRERHECLGKDRRPRRAPLLRPRGSRARSRRTGGRRQDRQGSRHAPARPAVGTAPRRRQLPVPGRKAHARPPATPEYQGARRPGGRHAHPHPAGHRAAGGRCLRLHRPSGQRAAAGRGHGIPARPGPAPRPQPAHAAGLARGTRPRPRREEALSRRPLRRPRRL